MNNKMSAFLTTAIVTGLMEAGTAHAQAPADGGGDKAAKEKNSCKKDKECKKGDKDCCKGHHKKDKNSCKGKDGCNGKKADKNSCKAGANKDAAPEAPAAAPAPAAPAGH